MGTIACDCWGLEPLKDTRPQSWTSIPSRGPTSYRCGKGGPRWPSGSVRAGAPSKRRARRPRTPEKTSLRGATFCQLSLVLGPSRRTLRITLKPRMVVVLTSRTPARIGRRPQPILCRCPLPCLTTGNTIVTRDTFFVPIPSTNNVLRQIEA